MIRTLPWLLLAACGPADPPEYDDGWPNVPANGRYTVSGSGDDSCELLPILTEPSSWTLSTRSQARDAFAMVQDETSNLLQCGYDPPGYLCIEADLDTWLTGDRELAVWMDGDDTTDGFELTVEAIETCASAGGGCPDPCSSNFTLAFSGGGA